jgi:sugar phosphate isomerase/epimerase
MQLGFVTAIFGDLTFEQVLKHASEIGYDCVEVMCWPPGPRDRKYGGVTHLDCTEFTQAQADDARALSEKYGVEISALGYYPNALSHDDEEARLAQGHIRKVIDAATKLGLPGINTFIGANHLQPIDDNLHQFEKVWPDIIHHAENSNIRVGIENCPMLFAKSWPFGWNLARTPAIWRRMFEIIPSPFFGLNYDPSHLRMQLMDPITPIREFGQRIFHSHAKDMRIDPEKLDRLGSLALPMERSTAKIPGLGDINWGKYIGALSDAGFDGPVCVEVEDHAFEGSVDRRRKSLEISYGVLRPLIA